MTGAEAAARYDSDIEAVAERRIRASFQERGDRYQAALTVDEYVEYVDPGVLQQVEEFFREMVNDRPHHVNRGVDRVAVSASTPTAAASSLGEVFDADWAEYVADDTPLFIAWDRSVADTPAYDEFQTLLEEELVAARQRHQ